MKVATVQFAPVWKDAPRNIATMVMFVKAARNRGAQLVVLPELCTSGYSFLSGAEVRPFAEILTKDSGISKHMIGEVRPNSVAKMQGLSGELGVAIAWGLVEEDPGTGDLYNSQMLVLPTGEWTSYRKLNLWGNDLIWAKEGKASPPILKFAGKNIGLLVCADIRDKSDDIENFYEPGDADIVAYSANWGDGGFPATKWVKFAKQNQCFLVVSNRYGKETNNNFGEGGICVIEPCGKVHCEGLQWSESCIVYAEVP
jgi:predicted amidohydrolase